MQTNEIKQEDEIDLRELFSIVLKYKLFIVVFVTFFTLVAGIYAIMKPNIYESKAIFSPINNEKSGNIVPENLEAFVNLSIGQNGSAYQTYVHLGKNYSFMKKLILKYKLYENFFDSSEYVFPLGLHFATNENLPFGEIGETLSIEQENILFGIYQTLVSNLDIKEDIKSNLVVFSSKGPDRFLNQKIVEYFMESSGKYLKNKEMASIESKIESLKDEIAKVRDIDLKNRMLELTSTLYKRKIFLKTEDFSGLQNILMPEVPHVNEKIAPKRSLIIVVSIVTSFMLSIFFVFFLNFIRKEENTQS